MLDKPNLDDVCIISCLQNDYGITTNSLTFLPLGADRNTAVYKAIAQDTAVYFVKLRQDNFLHASVTVPKYLHEVGIQQIIPPIPTLSGKYWATVGSYKLILYPFVDGNNGFEIAPTPQQRIAFGQALKQFHSTSIPHELTQDVPREEYTAVYRDKVHVFLKLFANSTFQDTLSQALATFINHKQDEIISLIAKTEQLAQTLKSESLAFILCHADMHGWNMLIDTTGQFFIVDWDTLIFAPKERDMMFIGCGLGGITPSLEEEVSLFYEGYGQCNINQKAMTYFRLERIIQDISEFCEEILESDEGKNRQWALDTLKSNFLPNNTLDLALKLSNGK